MYGLRIRTSPSGIYLLHYRKNLLGNILLALKYISRNLQTRSVSKLPELLKVTQTLRVIFSYEKISKRVAISFFMKVI